MMELLFSVAILFQGCESDVRCRDDNGTEVDWLVEMLNFGNSHFHLFSMSAENVISYIYLCIIRYIVYKYPSGTDDLSYLYMDESTNGWTVSNKAINSKSGTLANTLKPLLDFYDRKVMY